VSGDKVHVEGDSDGIRKLRADIEESGIVDGESNVEFNREEGIELYLGNSEQ